MPLQPDRKNCFRTNPYQRRILAIPFFPMLLLNIFITGLLLKFRFDLLRVIAHPELAPRTAVIDQGTISFLAFLWIFFILVVLWALFVSSTLVGSFMRLIRELDTMIATKEKHHLRVRNGDDLAQELLQRVNVLIDHLPDHDANGNQLWKNKQR